MTNIVTTVTRAEILNVVAQTGHLPTVPRAIAQIEKELANPGVSAARIAELIQIEPALSAAVLRIANSALYAPRREITSITQAITHLGMDAIRRIVVVASMIRTWRNHSTVELHRFWIHSVAVGLVSLELANTSKSPLEASLKEAAFSAGLLHDLGALILLSAFPLSCAQIREKSQLEQRCMATIEREVWGIDHGEVAGALADRWQLPPMLRQVMVYHHRPSQVGSDVRVLVELVHVSDYLCNSQGFGRSEDTGYEGIEEGIWTRLGFDSLNLDPVVARVARQCDESKAWVDSLGTSRN